MSIRRAGRNIAGRLSLAALLMMLPMLVVCNGVAIAAPGDTPAQTPKSAPSNGGGKGGGGGGGGGKGGGGGSSFNPEGGMKAAMELLALGSLAVGLGYGVYKLAVRGSIVGGVLSGIGGGLLWVCCKDPEGTVGAAAKWVMEKFVGGG